MAKPDDLYHRDNLNMAMNPNDPLGVLEKNNKLPGAKPPRSPYGGFWPRLCALFLDTIIWSPLFVLIFLMREHHRLFYLYYLPFAYVIGIIYEVYLVKKFGGTPGKLIMGLKIRKLDGAPVGYKEAVLRYLPGFILSAAASTGLIMALMRMTDAGFLSAAAGTRYLHVATFKPAWNFWITVAGQTWLWSEFIVLLTNGKKRALHDYVAGTVVMRKSAIEPPERPRA